MKTRPEYKRYMNGHCVVCGELATGGLFAEKDAMPRHRKWMELCPNHLEAIKGIATSVMGRGERVVVTWGGKQWWFKLPEKPLQELVKAKKKAKKVHFWQTTGLTPCGWRLHTVVCSSDLRDVSCEICLSTSKHWDTLKKKDMTEYIEKNIKELWRITDEKDKKNQERKGSSMSCGKVCNCGVCKDIRAKQGGGSILFADGTMSELSAETEASIKESLGIKPPKLEKRFYLWHIFKSWTLVAISTESYGVIIPKKGYRMVLLRNENGNYKHPPVEMTVKRDNSGLYVNWLPTDYPQECGHPGYGIKNMKAAQKKQTECQGDCC